MPGLATFPGIRVGDSVIWRPPNPKAPPLLVPVIRLTPACIYVALFGEEVGFRRTQAVPLRPHKEKGRIEKVTARALEEVDRARIPARIQTYLMRSPSLDSLRDVEAVLIKHGYVG